MMRVVLLAIALLGVLIHPSWAGPKDCGCLPGREGDVGPQGNTGRKGETGQKGEQGFRGDQGDTGPRGPKGNTGAKGEPGRNAPIPGVEPTFGPAGEAGPPGKCLCNARRMRDPVIAGDYFLTDETGEPNFIGDDLNEEEINRMFEHDETTPAPETFKVQAAPNHNGLFMMSPNGVLVPVTDASAYELFAAANEETRATTTTTTTRRTTTTTTRPYYNQNYNHGHNNNLYILGPKGSLIPIDALGLKKPFMHGLHGLHGHHGGSHGHGHGHYNNNNYHNRNNTGNYYGSNYHGSNYHGNNYHGHKFHGGKFQHHNPHTSSYNQWLRGILMGEDYPDTEDDDPFDNDDANTDDVVTADTVAMTDKDTNIKPIQGEEQIAEVLAEVVEEVIE